MHVFGPDAPEPWRHRVLRDHLRRDADDRALYARAKREAAAAHDPSSQTTMDYNRAKEAAVREIAARAFAAAGLVGRAGEDGEPDGGADAGRDGAGACPH